MITLILFLPFCSFLFSILAGSRILREEGLKIFIPTIWISILTLAIFSFLSLISTSLTIEMTIGTWLKNESFHCLWGWQLNRVTLTMILLIIGVSSLVHIYSLSYMEGDPHIGRFMSYLSLFTTFMLILVTSPNLIQLFIGWEGVGVCSYLLINFWSTRVLASQSAFKAMAVNKVGDMAFLVACGLLSKTYGTFSINIINACILKGSVQSTTLIASICFLVALSGKSAQLGLHTWLPDAMEGPTPVSALIHAATMVTAGVFLTIKLSPLFGVLPLAKLFIMLIGGSTCLLSAIIGYNQSDIKKVIAYSTCSQLGYMVLICGYGYYEVGLFHLFNHGIFKALLFLSAGLAIHACSNEQSLLKMGLNSVGLLGKYGVYVGSLAICGFPFLTGFYSKDLLLELLAANHTLLYPLWLAYLAASLTCFYSLKVISLAFNTKGRFSILTMAHFHESSSYLTTPLFILSLGSVMAGYVLSLALLTPQKVIIVSNFSKLLPLIVGLALVYGSYLSKADNSLFKNIFATYSDKVDHSIPHYNALVSRGTFPILKVGFNETYKLIDGQIIEFTAVNNPLRLTMNALWQSSEYITMQLYYSGRVIVLGTIFVSLLSL